ncbi:NlpC/P60 family protein [Paenibacillus sambharensis]|uniref:NlpC/P60 family protein n=2 Tax=Paenibacillus sambharensis TaxID=1803190 RepID=A0A2W1M002_9BACL|nr:NlpC/P60 family protein [Paenibacillus sambharensis]
MLRKSFMKRLAAVSLSATIGFSALALGSSSQVHAATPQSEEMIATAKEYLGVPYRFGAPSGVNYAFDCSSFTQYIYKQAEVKLPRTSQGQAKVGEEVSKDNLSQGDLVFFNTSGKGISHVGIYAGSNKFIHTSSSKGVVESSISSGYWSKNYVTARRVL